MPGVLAYGAYVPYHRLDRTEIGKSLGSGDGAAAFVVGPESAGLPVLAELVTSASATEESLDRWRIPGDVTSRILEERFGEEVYLPLAAAAFADAVKQADLTPDAIDHLIV